MSLFFFGNLTNGKLIYLSMYVLLFGISPNGKITYLYSCVITISNFMREFYMPNFEFYACIIMISNLYA
jgi:hypothetical protein